MALATFRASFTAPAAKNNGAKKYVIRITSKPLASRTARALFLV